MSDEHVSLQAVADALFGGCGFVPDVASLQAWLECAWAAGFDPMGAEQLGRCTCLHNAQPGNFVYGYCLLMVVLMWLWAVQPVSAGLSHEPTKACTQAAPLLFMCLIFNETGQTCNDLV